jgi:hypothetical protein
MELTLTAGFCVFFYVVGKIYIPPKLLQCFITLLMDRYNDRLLLLIGQFLLAPNRKNKFMDLMTNFSGGI